MEINFETCAKPTKAPNGFVFLIEKLFKDLEYIYCFPRDITNQYVYEILAPPTLIMLFLRKKYKIGLSF